MNEQEMESYLRKAPRVRVPADLRRKLEADIELPQRNRITNRESRLANTHWLRRWMPALGFALWILGCVVVMGIQGSMIVRLKQQNAELQAGVPTPSSMESIETVTASSSPELTELERLRKDVADVQRLRAEAEQLRELLAQIPTLRAANSQLREELKAKGQVAAPPNPEEDIFAASKHKAMTVACVNNLKQVGLAARMWANDNKDILPADFATVLGRELPSEKVTFCPSDGTTRYEILSPGADEKDPQVVYARCPIHNNVGLVDGSVQQIGTRKVVQQDGKWIIEPRVQVSEGQP